MAMRVPINPDTGKPVQPDKGWGVTPRNLGHQLEKWTLSKVSLRKTKNRYKLPLWKNRRAYPVRIDKTRELEQLWEVMHDYPDEVWGMFQNGKPIMSFMKKFRNEITEEVFVAKMCGTKPNEHTIRRVNRPSDERIGFPIFIGE